MVLPRPLVRTDAARHPGIEARSETQNPDPSAHRDFSKTLKSAWQKAGFNHKLSPCRR